MALRCYRIALFRDDGNGRKVVPVDGLGQLRSEAAQSQGTRKPCPSEIDASPMFGATTYRDTCIDGTPRRKGTSDHERFVRAKRLPRR